MVEKTYVFTRICFGNKPSPPIAELSMIKIAQSGKTTHPLGYKCLYHKRYMDDIMDACNDKIKLRKIKDEVTELLGKFGFQIKNWYSNHRDIGTIKDQQKILHWSFHFGPFLMDCFLIEIHIIR